MPLTAKDLLEMRDIIEKRKKRTLTVETELGEVKFRLPTLEELEDSFKFNDADGADGDEYLIYVSMVSPDLHDEELQKQLLGPNADPTTIVRTIFMPGEIRSMASIIAEHTGYKDDAVKVVNEVKN